jgi:hypothetical protein
VADDLPTPKVLLARLEGAGLPRLAAGAVLLSVTLAVEEIERATGATIDAGAVATAVVARILIQQSRGGATCVAPGASTETRQPSGRPRVKLERDDWPRPSTRTR